MTTLDDALAAVMKARLAMRAAGLDGAELARVARWIAAELRHTENLRPEQVAKKERKICTTKTDGKRRTGTR